MGQDRGGNTMNERSRGPESIPGQATDAPPGSPRKVRVLMERAARRESLFHPADNMKRLLPMPVGPAHAEPADEYDIDLAS